MTPEEPRIESTEEEPLPNNDQWTRNRRELLEWLGKTSPSLAELYKTEKTECRFAERRDGEPATSIYLNG